MARGGAAGAAIVLADVDGTIAAWSTGAERLFGHAAGDVVGRRLDVIVPEAYRDAHWAGFRRPMATGECRLDRAATNLPVLHADGTARVFPARFVFLADPRGAPAGALGIFAEPAGGEAVWGPILELGDAS